MIADRLHFAWPWITPARRTFEGRARGTVCLALLLVCGPAASLAQGSTPASAPAVQTDPQLTFEVASIRESAPAPPYSQYVSSPPHKGTFDVIDIWMTQVIAGAYDVNYRTQLVGGPDWIGRQRFAIHARSSAEVEGRLAAMTDEEASEAKRAMLRVMLAERFGLKVHFETRMDTVYTMSFAKPSPNLKESAAGGSGEGTGKGEPGIRSLGGAGHIEMVAHQVSMEKLAGMLAFYLKNEVVDRTGLTGLYDFDVTFDPHPELETDAPNAAPPVEVAFPQQLGLKLTRGKAPVKTLVVDALSMPTPN